MDSRKTFIVICGIVLILITIKGALGNELTKDTLFPKQLEYGKNSPGSMVLELKTGKNVNENMLTWETISRKGNLKKVKWLAWQNCTRINQTIVQKRVCEFNEFCYEPDTKTGLCCYNKFSHIQNESFVVEDWCEITEMKPDMIIKPYFNHKDIEWGDYGYEFDLIPCVTVDGSRYCQNKYSWFDGNWTSRWNLTMPYPAHNKEPIILPVANFTCANANYSDLRIVADGSSQDYEFLNTSFHHVESGNPTYIQWEYNSGDNISVYCNNSNAMNVNVEVYNTTYMFNSQPRPGAFGTKGYGINSTHCINRGLGCGSLHPNSTSYQAGDFVQEVTGIGSHVSFFLWDDYYTSSGADVIYMLTGGDVANFLWSTGLPTHGAGYYCNLAGSWNALYPRQYGVWQNIYLNITLGSALRTYQSNQTGGGLPAYIDTHSTDVPPTLGQIKIKPTSSATNPFYIDNFISKDSDFNQYYTPNVPQIGELETQGAGGGGAVAENTTKPIIQTLTKNIATPDITHNVTISAVATDVENATFTFMYWIYNNSVLHVHLNYTSYANNSNYSFFKLNNTMTALNDTWNFTVRAYDLTNYSNWSSIKFTIANYTPPASGSSNNSSAVSSTYQPDLEGAFSGNYPVHTRTPLNTWREELMARVKKYWTSLLNVAAKIYPTQPILVILAVASLLVAVYSQKHRIPKINIIK